MMKSISRSACSASVIVALTAGASSAESIFRDPVDLTFNLRVKVEGNIEAINQGLGITCWLVGDGEVADRQVATKQILAPGQVFTPQTQDGFVETSITFNNLSQDNTALILPDREPPPEAQWRYNPAFGFNCYTAQIGAGGDWEPMFTEIRDGIRAKDPAYRGSCIQSRSIIDHSGELPFRLQATCAE